MLPARHLLLSTLAVSAAAALAGCGGGQSGDQSSAAPVPAPDPPSSRSAASPTEKRIILLDPGHNGGNADHPAEIGRKVPDGRGATKPCNTVGTATDDGTPEHAVNLHIAWAVQDVLQANGVTVLLTRDDDSGWGPCVDVRGKMAAKVNADAEISLHADGAAPAGHGFHVIYAKPPLNPAQGRPSVALAEAIRAGMSDQILPTSTYVGRNGLIGRSDLAGLNWASRPAVLVEVGNMKNAEDATNMESDAGRARIAVGIANGIMRWLGEFSRAQLAAAESTTVNSTAESSRSSTAPHKHPGSASESAKPTRSAGPSTSPRQSTPTGGNSTSGESTEPTTDSG